MIRKIIISSVVSLFYVVAQSQNIGTNNTDPKSVLDVKGDLALRLDSILVADGYTYDLNVNTNKATNYKLYGPTGNFILAGIKAGNGGRFITLTNRSGHSMEVYNEDLTAVDTMRIITSTGTTLAIYPNGNVSLQYDKTMRRWQVTNSHYGSLDNFGSGNWAVSGNNIYNANVGNVGVGSMTPLTSLQVNGNLSLFSNTILTPCSSMLFNGKILFLKSVSMKFG